MRVALALLVSSLSSVALTGDAFAFQIESPITFGCHEKITVEARRAAGYPDTSLAPAPTVDQRRASDDLTFTLPADESDVWTMTLLIGVRSNDIKDYPILDPASLVEIHDDPNDQPAHCIRRLEDDGPDGDASALAACRQFILDELFTGRFFVDTVDTGATEVVPVYLSFRLQTELELPRFAYRLGRAIHALEDGYAHTLRNPETGEVRHVTNWIDFSTNEDYDVDRDGYQHLATIDDCLRRTDVERSHIEQARAAVTDLLNALRDPTGGGDERQSRVEAVLDRVFTIEPGCTLANRYCAARELDEQSPGCSAGGGAGLGVLVALLGLFVRRRRAGAARPLDRRGAKLVVLSVSDPILALLLVGGTAAADDTPAQEGSGAPVASPDPAAPVPVTPPPEAAKAEPVKEQTLDTQRTAEPTPLAKPHRDRFAWHGDFRFGAALDHAALAFAGGAGVDINLWTVGMMIEWNPWFSLDTSRAREGSLNIYATLARRWYDDDRFTLYSRAELGTSTVLFDLVGVDEYQTGVYLGGALLGVSLKKHHGLRMTLDPSHFAMPIPKPSGLPFYWRQYRIAIGLEFRFQ